MKRYVVVILIPCLLMQLFGCYSYREITIEELKKYDGEDDMKIVTEHAEFILNRDSAERNKPNWVANDSSIIMQEKGLLDSSYKENPIRNKNEIKFQQIISVSINEPDSGETEGLILLTIVFVVAVTVSLIAIVNDNFMTIGN